MEASTGEKLLINIEKRCVNGPMTSEAISRLNVVRPHLARAALLSARIELEKTLDSVNTLGAFGSPAAALAADGRVLATNELLEGLAPQVESRIHSRIGFGSVAADRSFEMALAMLRGTGALLGARSIVLPAIDDLPVAVAHLVPVTGQARDLFSRAALLLLITPVSRQTAPPNELLRDLSDLTSVEARVARELLEGSSVDEIAAASSVGTNTLRNQLKSVFAKTGVHRQAELVSLLAGVNFPSPERPRTVTTD